MPGINLSQSLSLGAKKAETTRSLFDKSFVGVIVLTLIVLALWGALRFFLYRTDQDIEDLQAKIDSSQGALTGDAVARVASVGARLEHLGAYQEQAAGLKDAFGRLENLTLPAVRLTSFQYVDESGTTTIAGVADNYRTLAEQVLRYKGDEAWKTLKVTNIANTEDGKISFTLSAVPEPVETPGSQSGAVIPEGFPAPAPAN
jgi:hypothetical protein